MRNEQFENLRQAIEEARSGGQRRFGPELREQIIRYVAHSRAQGVTIKQALMPLALSTSVYFGWLQQSGSKAAARPRFLPVRVAAEKVERKGVSVHGPMGVRIEGLAVDEIAELIKRLHA